MAGLGGRVGHLSLPISHLPSSGLCLSALYHCHALVPFGTVLLAGKSDPLGVPETHLQARVNPLGVPEMHCDSFLPFGNTHLHLELSLSLSREPADSSGFGCLPARSGSSPGDGPGKLHPVLTTTACRGCYS